MPNAPSPSSTLRSVPPFLSFSAASAGQTAPVAEPQQLPAAEETVPEPAMSPEEVRRILFTKKACVRPHGASWTEYAHSLEHRVVTVETTTRIYLILEEDPWRTTDTPIDEACVRQMSCACCACVCPKPVLYGSLVRMW